MPTENGHNDVVLENFNRTARDEVQRSEDVAAVNQRVAGRSVGRLELHRQCSAK